ncbi:L-threonylcarbamoyladenylate synthase [Algoriphagus namhaensis]
MAQISSDIDGAAKFLTQGELVGIPTETVYGLAANALNGAAVAQIFEVKNRPSFDPLIVHISGIEEVEKYASHFPEKLKNLARAFWPGPLTLLLPKKEIVPDLVTSGLARVALRVPSHPLTRSLLDVLDFPLAAPSANPFGYISPTQAGHVDAQLGDQIPFILDGGPCEVGLESTIVGMEEDEVIVYRMGGLAVDAIETVVGQVQVRDQSSSKPDAPGLLTSHYAPRVPFLVGDLDELISQAKRAQKDFAVLSLSRRIDELDSSRSLVLSREGSLSEAAQNLFAGMRQLDASGAEVILAEYMPETGLGRAMNDRLRRAAAKG